MSDQHALCPRETSTTQAADPAKVPASAPPSLSGMFKHARFLARFIVRFAVDKCPTFPVLLRLLIGRKLPKGMPAWSSAALADGLVYVLQELWYGAPRRWVQRCLDRLAQLG